MKQLFWCLFCKQRVKKGSCYNLTSSTRKKQNLLLAFWDMPKSWTILSHVVCQGRGRNDLESHQPGVSAILVFFPKCESSRTLCLPAVLCLGAAPSAVVYLKDIPATGHFCPTLSLLTKISNWHALRLRKLETKMQPFLPGPLWKSGNIWKHFS